jgi:hypothetical protein
MTNLQQRIDSLKSEIEHQRFLGYDKTAQILTQDLKELEELQRQQKEEENDEK